MHKLNDLGSVTGGGGGGGGQKVPGNYALYVPEPPPCIYNSLHFLCLLLPFFEVVCRGEDRTDPLLVHCIDHKCIFQWGQKAEDATGWDRDDQGQATAVEEDESMENRSHNSCFLFIIYWCAWQGMRKYFQYFRCCSLDAISAMVKRKWSIRFPSVVLIFFVVRPPSRSPNGLGI